MGIKKESGVKRELGLRMARQSSCLLGPVEVSACTGWNYHDASHANANDVSFQVSPFSPSCLFIANQSC